MARSYESALATPAGGLSHPAARALPRSAVSLAQMIDNRRMSRILARQPVDPGAGTEPSLVGGAESILQKLCKELNTATGSPAACAKNSKCPSGFCVPLPNKVEAIGIRNLVRDPLLLGIRVKVNPRVVPFWDDFMGSGLGVGGDAAVRDLTPTFGRDFTNSPTTADTTKFLTRELIKDLEASRPTVPAGTSTSIDIPTRIPAAVKAITTPTDANEMNFDVPSDIAGNLAGGIGADEASCPVGAHPSPQNDDRLVTGTAKLTGNADGSLTVEPDMTFEVHDTIDLCPGDCGTTLEQCATVILSRLEATGVSGDIPFKVRFAAPAQAPLRLAATTPVPPPTPPTPPPPSGAQLTCSRFMTAGGTPEPTLEACFEDRQRLGIGARGEPVRMVQEALLALGFDLGPFGADGKFGAFTAGAVRAFKTQEKLGFEEIGDVGPGTMKRLDALCP